MGDNSVTTVPVDDVVINHHFDEYDQSIKIYFTNNFVQNRHIMTFHKRKNKLKFTKFPDHDIPKFDRCLCQLLSEALDPMAPPGTKLLLNEKVHLMFLLETLKVMNKLRDTNVFFTSFIEAMTQLRNEILANQITTALINQHNSLNENVKVEESSMTRVKTEPQQKVNMILEIKEDNEDEIQVLEMKPEVIVLSEDEDYIAKQPSTSAKTENSNAPPFHQSVKSNAQTTFPKAETSTTHSASKSEPSRPGTSTSTHNSSGPISESSRSTDGLSNTTTSNSQFDLPDI